MLIILKVFTCTCLAVSQMPTDDKSSLMKVHQFKQNVSIRSR